MSEEVEEPASNRQIKLLTFFSQTHDFPLTKKEAQRKISRFFLTKPYYRVLWAKYKYLTGDEDNDSPELKPYDLEELVDLVIPDDWKPSTSKRVSGANKRILALVIDELKDGVPHDHPVPEIIFPNKTFVFTGKFDFGTRQDCHALVEGKGGIAADNVTTSSDYLVLGGTPNPNWSHQSYGNKIEKAFYLKFSDQKIFILAEEDWVKSAKG
jgi:NAD-dependent DNA ligase